MIINFFIKSLTSFLLLYSSLAWSAACCGGGVSSASVITNDDQAFFSSTFSNSKVDTDVFSDGIWKKRNAEDLTRTLKIDYAQIFNDRFQFGFSLPILLRKKSGLETDQSFSGLGDVSGQFGYEYLPDWDYNPWRPHGVGYLSLLAPTGVSIYDSKNQNSLDVRGRGFWTLGLGTFLNKSWSTWDASISSEVHYSFERRIDQQSKAKPEPGGSLSFGAGYNLEKIRIGQNVLFSYEGAIKVDGDLKSEGSPQRWATSTTTVSYIFKDLLIGSINYSDQTLFGSPSNTSLSKTWAVSIQKKWSR